MSSSVSETLFLQKLLLECYHGDLKHMLKIIKHNNYSKDKVEFLKNNSIPLLKASRNCPKIHNFLKLVVQDNRMSQSLVRIMLKELDEVPEELI